MKLVWSTKRQRLGHVSLCPLSEQSPFSSWPEKCAGWVSIAYRTKEVKGVIDHLIGVARQTETASDTNPQ